MSSSLSSNHFNEDSSSDDSTISYPDRSDFPQVLSEEDVKEVIASLVSQQKTGKEIYRTPSRLPSRHSTQIITPARSSHPNYVRPSDSQRSIAQTSRTRKKGKSLNTESEADSVVQSQPNQSSSQNRTRKPPPTSQKKSQRKRKKTPITNDSDNNSENADRIMDYTQDSDEENSKIRRSNKKKINTFDPIRDYFKAPFHANETDTNICL
ncbi:hypothetical protein PtA15_1A779 [Puccinia triticina]|uniref:Uncharacterized protein n=1 Tax=Puccinia triticina TaxID=208348 RepID=A0ABY7C950_9BASI|nr:uncharacterized protein PtA15_1A779 [Puccinia triticina]WAQ81438.1 hypothetical protein PtA15_1A779 [Puccinia triticina]